MATDILTFRLPLATATAHRLSAPPVVAARLGLDRLYTATLRLTVRYSVALTLE